MMTAALLASQSNRTHLYITAHLEQADNARDDLELFLGRPCQLFPAWETLPGEGSASREIEAERLRLCTCLRRAAPVGRVQRPDSSPERDTIVGSMTRPTEAACSATIVVAPIQALMQPVPTPEALERNTLHLATGPEVGSAPRTKDVGSAPRIGLLNASGTKSQGGPDALLEWAVDRGFERLELVESPGDVAKRGDIVDLFAPGELNPYRVQFFGDQVESIRRFDVGTQRSMEGLDSVTVTVMVWVVVVTPSKTETSTS